MSVTASVVRVFGSFFGWIPADDSDRARPESRSRSPHAEQGAAPTGFPEASPPVVPPPPRSILRS